MRKYFRDVVQDVKGNAISGAQISIYRHGTTDPMTVYDAETDGNAYDTPPQLTTDSTGEFEFWLEDVQDVDIKIEAPGLATKTIYVQAKNYFATSSYSALVYKENSTYYAIDYKGSIISSGTDGGAVLQAAIDYVYDPNVDNDTYGRAEIKLLTPVITNQTIYLKNGVYLSGGEIKAGTNLTYLVATEKYTDYLANPSADNQNYQFGLGDILLNADDKVSSVILAIAGEYFEIDNVHVHGGDHYGDKTGVHIVSTHPSSSAVYFGKSHIGYLKIDSTFRGIIVDSYDVIIDNLIVQHSIDVGFWLKKTVALGFAHVWGSHDYKGENPPSYRGYAVYITDNGCFKGIPKIEAESSDYGVVFGSKGTWAYPIEANLYLYANFVKDVYTEATDRQLNLKILRCTSDIEIDCSDTNKGSIVELGDVSCSGANVNLLGDIQVQGAIRYGNIWIDKLCSGILYARESTITVSGVNNNLSLLLVGSIVHFGKTDYALANSHIRVSGWWGDTDVKFDFPNDGGRNTIEIRAINGNLDLTGRSPTTVLRGGAQGKYLDYSGKATFSGNDSDTQFSITHNLLFTPEKVHVTAGSDDAKGDFYVTVDDTYIYVHYATPPPSGSDNVVLYWTAEV